MESKIKQAVIIHIHGKVKNPCTLIWEKDFGY